MHFQVFATCAGIIGLFIMAGLFFRYCYRRLPQLPHRDIELGRLGGGQPGMAAAQPGVAVAQPGMAVAQTGMAAAQPGVAVAQPGMAVGQMTVGQQGQQGQVPHNQK